MIFTVGLIFHQNTVLLSPRRRCGTEEAQRQLWQTFRVTPAAFRVYHLQDQGSLEGNGRGRGSDWQTVGQGRARPKKPIAVWSFFGLNSQTASHHSRCGVPRGPGHVNLCPCGFILTWGITIFFLLIIALQNWRQMPKKCFKVGWMFYLFIKENLITKVIHLCH